MKWNEIVVLMGYLTKRTLTQQVLLVESTACGWRDGTLKWQGASVVLTSLVTFVPAGSSVACLATAYVRMVLLKMYRVDNPGLFWLSIHQNKRTTTQQKIKKWRTKISNDGSTSGSHPVPD